MCRDALDGIVPFGEGDAWALVHGERKTRPGRQRLDEAIQVRALLPALNKRLITSTVVPSESTTPFRNPLVDVHDVHAGTRRLARGARLGRGVGQEGELGAERLDVRRVEVGSGLAPLAHHQAPARPLREG